MPNVDKVKIVVKSSKCHMYKEGDAIYFDAAFIDKEKSAALCMTALQAIYPFVYAARKGLGSHAQGFGESLTFQCPDIADMVEFTIYPMDGYNTW